MASISKQSPRKSAPSRYLPQDFGVYPRVTAYDLLDHMAVLKGIATKAERRDTVETLLAQVNLWEVRKKPLRDFWWVCGKRFGIAQALIGNPDLILPTNPLRGWILRNGTDF
ncbi:MAG: hypothetical protein CM15mP74_27750 [Halieaceae bacterium]|nr:MAG: hypothetical protein CM15mP74_27750 [Halieaceae bacterium]